MNITEEIRLDDERIAQEEFVLSEIEAEGEIVMEAIGTEATLLAINMLRPECKALLAEAIKCEGSKAQGMCDEEFGRYMRKAVFNYVIRGMSE